eukprot:11217110-Prorocentrum_lima.AAC.1
MSAQQMRQGHFFEPPGWMCQSVGWRMRLSFCAPAGAWPRPGAQCPAPCRQPVEAGTRRRQLQGAGTEPRAPRGPSSLVVPGGMPRRFWCPG